MNKKTTPIAIGAVAIIIAGIVVFAQNMPSGSPEPVPTPVSSGSATTTYTLADIATHNNSSSCWTAVNGGVYDVTTFISQHPGGSQAILSLCGHDGSSAFNGQHGGESRPAAELASFKIGTLKQ